MTTTRPDPRLRALSATAALTLLVAPLAACAPEAGDVAGSPGKDGDDGTSWSPPEDDLDLGAKQTDIPEGFPLSDFPVPDGAEVDDTGTRDEASWFIVFRADDAAAADRLWDRIIDDGDFDVEGENETSDGGRAASLQNDVLAVQALTITQSDESVLLSYDLTLL